MWKRKCAWEFHRPLLHLGTFNLQLVQFETQFAILRVLQKGEAYRHVSASSLSADLLGDTVTFFSSALLRRERVHVLEGHNIIIKIAVHLFGKPLDAPVITLQRTVSIQLSRCVKSIRVLRNALHNQYAAKSRWLRIWGFWVRHGYAPYLKYLIAYLKWRFLL